MKESIWAQIDRLKREHAEEVRGTAKKLAARGWQGPAVDGDGVWSATTGEGEGQLRVEARTSRALLQRVDEQRGLLQLAGLEA